MRWKFFPGPERKATAVLSLCAAVLFTFWTIRSAGDAVFMYHYTKTPSYHHALGNGLVPENIPPFAEFALIHPVLLDFLQTFLLANAAVIAFGLWRGRSWGRVSAVYFLYLSALVMLAFVLYPSFVVPEPYIYHGMAPFPEFNQRVRIISLVMRTAAVFFIFLFIVLARYFENLSVYPADNFYLPAGGSATPGDSVAAGNNKGGDSCHSQCGDEPAGMKTEKQSALPEDSASEDKVD